MNNVQFKAARIAASLTQEAMADRLGISARHVKRLESGATPIRETIARLVAVDLKGN